MTDSQHYLKAKNFTQRPDKQRQVNDLIKKMNRQVRVNGSQHSATYHYASNYGYIPLWILVKVLSFGIVCEMVSILKPEDQHAISEVYGIDSENLIVYLPILANYRNLCAHEDILYENKTQTCINDTIYHKLLDVPKENNEYIYGKNDLFAVIIIFKILLNKKAFRLMMKEIEYEIELLDGKVDTIEIDRVLDRMGFPEDYMNIIGR